MGKEESMFDKKLYRSDMVRCVLCSDAPCTKACGRIDPARMLRSIWFDNEKTAADLFPVKNPCTDCSAPCEAACVRAWEVPIRSLMCRLHDEVKPALEIPSPDTEERLAADFCGIRLENPFLLSSSVVASTYDMCARAFEAGWAGAAFKTICSFEIHEASPRFSAITGADGNIIGFKNIEQLSDHSVMENMEIFRRLKEKYPSKFILASIMGKDESEWEMLAHLCEENGADAIELNFSCPNMAEGGLGSDIGQIPELVECYTAAASRGVKIPVLAKLTPNVARMSPAAEAAMRGGASGIAAINTIKSIIDVNRHTYRSAPAVHGMSAVGGYSGNAVKPIALRFIAELGQNPALSGMHLGIIAALGSFLFPRRKRLSVQKLPSLGLCHNQQPVCHIRIVSGILPHPASCANHFFLRSRLRWGCLPVRLTALGLCHHLDSSGRHHVHILRKASGQKRLSGACRRQRRTGAGRISQSEVLSV